MTLESYLGDLKDEDKPLRHSELLKLSGLSSEEVSELNEAWDDIDESRRSELLSRLVELSEDNAEFDFSAVYRARLKDQDPGIRANAARGLWECDDRIIIRPLTDILTKDPEAAVRCAAAITLGKFSTMALDGKLTKRDAERVRDALMTAIRAEDEDAEVQRRATESVAAFNSPEVERIIRDAYHSDEPKLRQSAIYAMGNTSDPQWLPTLIDELDHDIPAFRYEAANACGQLGDDSTVPHLVRLIDDDDLQVALAAVRSLGTIGGNLAKRALVQCLKLGDESLEAAAEAGLRRLEIDEDPLGLRFQV